MTVKLLKRVLSHWREVSADTYKVQIELLLTSRLGHLEATEALSQSVTRALREFETRHADTFETTGEPWPGSWDVLPVPEGAILIGGYKSDAFEEVLQGIVADLEAHGVRGKLDLYTPPEPPTLPRGRGIVKAQLRVLGQRVPDAHERWAADRAALGRVTHAAVSWCMQNRPDRGVTISRDALPTLLVRRCDPPLARFNEVLADDAFWVTLNSVGDERFRSVRVEPRSGGVVIAEGGPVLHRAGWNRSVNAVTAFMRAASADTVYGFIRRTTAGTNPDPELGDRLYRNRSLDAAAHEDHYAPDAYAVQLLGPSYAGRIPTGADWTTTELDAGRVLVEHNAPDAWFEEPTLEQAVYGERMPTDATREQARADFKPILFTPPTREQRDRRREWENAHPPVELPEDIVVKVRSLPPTPFIGHWRVALQLRDGSLIEDVELGREGTVVTRIAGNQEFSLGSGDIVDVLDRSQ